VQSSIELDYVLMAKRAERMAPGAGELAPG
jgi:hypothetical protein